ncbi:MAG: hypothetical protein SGI97_02880 [candidate division Zixibacteria bacterium]|nr:hypothetical protein [candidate division Zixibacteria bacterium]
MSCIEKRQAYVEQLQSPITVQLKDLVDENNRLRVSPSQTPQSLAEMGRRHRQVIYRLISQLLISDAEELYWAASILYHTDSLAGAEPSLLAYYMAEEAANRGNTEARDLKKLTLDRFLVLSGLSQKHGTQSYRDSFGKQVPYPVDSSLSDSEIVSLLSTGWLPSEILDSGSLSPLN